jgi:Tfp pilus assembly PilM family ATPase
MEIDQAEKAKIICGLDEGKAKGIVKNALHGMIKDLASRINESIIFYNHHFQTRGPLDEILLCGGGANIKNLDKIINEYINVKVSIGNIFINLNENRDKILKLLSETHALGKGAAIKNMPSQKITQDTSLSFATAIGLALRGIFLNKL